MSFQLPIYSRCENYACNLPIHEVLLNRPLMKSNSLLFPLMFPLFFASHFMELFFGILSFLVSTLSGEILSMAASAADAVALLFHRRLDKSPKVKRPNK